MCPYHFGDVIPGEHEFTISAVIDRLPAPGDPINGGQAFVSLPFPSLNVANQICIAWI
jgi:hypothetical protein